MAIIVLAQRASRPDAPDAPGPFAAPATGRPAAWDVERADDGRLTVSSGTSDDRKANKELVVPASAPVDMLEPIAASEIAPGGWLTLIGIPNEVKNFSIRLVVFLPSPGPPGDDGIARSAARFAGHEAERDDRELPLLGGVVDHVDGLKVTLRAPGGGAIEVSLPPGSPLRGLRAARASEIRPGDRIALHDASDGTPDVGAGVLVLAGGAR